MPAVYRAPMRARRDDVDPTATLDRAFALGLCGFGDAPRDPRVDRRVTGFAAVPATYARGGRNFQWTHSPAAEFETQRI